MAALCGMAANMRRMLNPPTMTFSTQNRSSVTNTLQPKNSTPTSGTRLAATSTTTLGVRRKAGRTGAGGAGGVGGVTAHYDAMSAPRRQGLARREVPPQVSRLLYFSRRGG